MTENNKIFNKEFILALMGAIGYITIIWGSLINEENLIYLGGLTTLLAIWVGFIWLK